MLGPLLLEGGRRREFPLPYPSDDFTPRAISGLALWFDAQDLGTLYRDDALTTPVSADSQGVGGWIDKAAGLAATQATGTLRPLYRSASIGDLPAIEADGVDDGLHGLGISLNQPMTVYCVCKFTASGDSLFWLDGNGSPSDRVRLQTNSTGAWAINAGTILAAGASDTLAHRHSVIVNGASSLYYLDGNLIAGPGDAGSALLSGFSLFCTRTGASTASGMIGELILYSGAHSDAQRRLVESYLQGRWKL